MKTFKKLNIFLAALGLVALTAAQAYAQLVSPPAILTGTNGKIVIAEREDDFNDDALSDIQYLIDILDESEVHAFAVSNNKSGFDLVGSTWSSVSNWSHKVILAADWDTEDFSIGGTLSVETGDLGSFSSLFGGDQMVALFYRDTGGLPISAANDNDEVNWPTTAANFVLFDATYQSEFIALDGAGNLIDFSPIPEPGTFALMAIGIGVAARFLRRRMRNRFPDPQR